MKKNNELTISYNESLLNLLTKKTYDIKDKYTNTIEIDIYMTLLSHTINNYPSKKNQQDYKSLEEFLRKLNNLKVKIQLKRKVEETSILLSELVTLLQNNELIIARYNKEAIDIESVIGYCDVKQLTTIIDKLTKEKIRQDLEQDRYEHIRTTIYQNFENLTYQIKDDKIIITASELKESLEVSIQEFKDIFYYLLDPANYELIYQKVEANNQYKKIIESLINALKTKNYPEVILPIILMHISNQQKLEYETLDTSSFKIDNIKITELYSFANTKQETESIVAKWQNISIPNNYLLTKLKIMTKNGMYYLIDDNFIFENTTNDFKVSISKEKLTEFLVQVLNNIINDKNVKVS